MTTQTFPFTFSTYMLSQTGYSETTLKDPILRSTVDKGPPRSRKQYSLAVPSFKGQIDVMSSADVDTIQTFYDTYGAEDFNWQHPRTHVTGLYHWLARPEIIGVTGSHFSVSVNFYRTP